MYEPLLPPHLPKKLLNNSSVQIGRPRIIGLFTDDTEPRLGTGLKSRSHLDRIKKNRKITHTQKHSTWSKALETDYEGREAEQEKNASSLKGLRFYRPRISMRISKIFGYSDVSTPRTDPPENLGMVEAEKCTYICESTALAKARQAEMVDPFMRALPGGAIVPSYYALDVFEPP